MLRIDAIDAANREGGPLHMNVEGSDALGDASSLATLHIDKITLRNQQWKSNRLTSKFLVLPPFVGMV